jgi:hypothetical protein
MMANTLVTQRNLRHQCILRLSDYKYCTYIMSKGVNLLYNNLSKQESFHIVIDINV